MRKLAFALTAVISLLAIAGSASASTISIKDVQGAWTSVVGGTDVTPLGESSVSWGIPKARGKSGYDFEGTSPSGPHEVDSTFTLGTFTHRNRPIAVGSSILAASLAVTFTFVFDDNPLVEFVRTSIFDFSHFETRNNDRVCANGQANRTGVNVRGCADSVTATTNRGFSETFDVNGVSYLFDVTGFVGGVDFWTVEKRRNSAELRGRLITVPSPVPLPAAGWMLLAGIAAVGFVGRRRAFAKAV
jgi:hypothetical protein